MTAILVSRYNPPNFDEFINRYTALIETRILTDFNVKYRIKTYSKLLDIYNKTRKQMINPIAFLDYCFRYSDGLPIPQKMYHFLKSYKEKSGYVPLKTIYDIVGSDINKLKQELSEYDDAFEFYVTNLVHPFIVVFDGEIMQCIKFSNIPDQWKVLDPQLNYLKQIYASYLQLPKFKKMYEFIYIRLAKEG